MISKKKIKHLANLSKIYLTDKELHKFSSEFDNIIHHLDMLQKMDTSSISDKKIDNVIKANRQLRPDEIQKSLKQTDVLKNSKDKKQGLIVVPKIFN